MNQAVFYQDFLFQDLLTNDNDFPVVKDLKIVKEFNPIDYIPYEVNLGPICNISIDFMSLMNVKEELKWEEMMSVCSGAIEVIIIDNIQIENEELFEYKHFYLLVYYYWFQRTCRSVSVFINDDAFCKYINKYSDKNINKYEPA